MRFCVVQDQDSHWFLCPAEKRDEASKYFEAADKYWGNPNASGEPPDEPEYLQRIDGLHRLTFTDPQYE